MENVVFRHEWKYPITMADVEVLRRKLCHLMKPDPHAIDGQYLIRSLYFDNFDDKALTEKLDGDYARSKFRIRIYNGSDSFIALEKKSKTGDLTQKHSARLKRSQYEQIMRGDIQWMRDDGRAVLAELYYRMTAENMRPKTIVEYTRYPFIYEPGNVRVTLDHHIRTGVFSVDLFGSQKLAPSSAPHVLEVKYDNFLPDVIAGLVNYVGRGRASVSKYASCRVYG